MAWRTACPGQLAAWRLRPALPWPQSWPQERAKAHYVSSVSPCYQMRPLYGRKRTLLAISCTPLGVDLNNSPRTETFCPLCTGPVGLENPVNVVMVPVTTVMLPGHTVPVAG